MTSDPKRSTSPELRAAHIGHVFRYLADEHQETKRRDDAEVTWQAVEYRLRFGRKLRPSFWTRLSPPGAFSPGKWAFMAAAAAVCLAAGGAGWLLSESTGKAARSARVDEGQTGSVQTGSVHAGSVHTGSVRTGNAALHYDITSPTGQSIGAAPSPGTSQLLATEQESKLVRFSDSSVIELRPYTTMRVSVLESGTVVARLVQGALEVNVHHQERTDYRFQAGDYEVKVVGTAFNLAFDPQPSRFHLNLHEGRVIVDDGAGQTRVLNSGQALHIPGEDDSSARDGALGSVSLESLADQEAAPAYEPGPASAPSYRELARKGQFQAIVSAARRSGVDRVLAAKGPAELHELAQAARYTGQVALSEKVFSHLASQHARSSEGRGAAFFRGRLAEDSGRFQQAQQHYHAYLAHGGGPYAAEALGRELTLVQKLKGPGAARPLASEYLRRFPRGAYRNLAQTLAQGSSGQGSSGQGSSATR